MPTIRFYRTRDAHGDFSNFAPFPIVLRGQVWPTSEHFFQAQKFAGTEREDRIRQAPTPADAARLGRGRNIPLRADWEQVKVEVMLEALRAKFRQHPRLRASLLATGDATLVEHTENDAYWADGGDGRGQNMLGRLLMQVRDELRSEAQPPR